MSPFAPANGQNLVVRRLNTHLKSAKFTDQFEKWVEILTDNRVIAENLNAILIITYIPSLHNCILGESNARSNWLIYITT